jgi:transposase-like protein
MGIMNELKTRGAKDILLAAVDGLSGFPDAIAAVFPKTEVQLCIVHMVRSSVRFVPYKDRKAVTAGLKKYTFRRRRSWPLPPWRSLLKCGTPNAR